MRSAIARALLFAAGFFTALIFLSAFAHAQKIVPTPAGASPNGAMIGYDGTNQRWLYMPVDTNGYLLVDGLGGGGGGGGSTTIQTNGTNNTSQTTLNFVNTGTITFANPSGGVDSASLVSPGATTILGFNASNAYTGYTAGAGISFAGNQISTTGSSGITGTLTLNCIPVATGTGTVGCSLATDDGTTFTITDPAGLAIASSLPGRIALGAGSGNLPSIPANSAGWASPLTGGVSYVMRPPATMTQGFLFAATPATDRNVLTSIVTPQSPTASLPGGTGQFGGYTSTTFLSGSKMPLAGHFTNIQVTNLTNATCTTAPTINVEDVTTSTLGSATVGSTTGTILGVTVDGAQTLPFAVGDDVKIYVQTIGSACGNEFSATAQYVTP